MQAGALGQLGGVVQECCEEYRLGIETQCTFSAPRASTAIAATSAESIPPERPISTEAKPFLRTYARVPVTRAA